MMMSACTALDVDASYLLETARTIKHYSHTKPAGNMLNQRYSLTNSGRLYAKGVNLQNAPNIVTDAALSGCWEYDFESCHFTIFAQLAESIGIQCTAISHYLDHKREVCNTIAVDVGLSSKQVKVCSVEQQAGFNKRIEALRQTYDGVSAIYQKAKAEGKGADVPLK